MNIDIHEDMVTQNYVDGLEKKVKDIEFKLKFLMVVCIFKLIEEGIIETTWKVKYERLVRTLESDKS